MVSSTILAIVCVQGCAGFGDRAELYPDKWAPRLADREWVAPSTIINQYAIVGAAVGQSHGFATVQIAREYDLPTLVYPNVRFRGRVQGVGWALYQNNRASIEGLPQVEETLNWVRLSQRFPVRIILEPSNTAFPFRMGANRRNNSGRSLTRECSCWEHPRL